MQQWEYLFLKVILGFSEKVDQINGNSNQNRGKERHYSDHANWLGAQGWELVNVASPVGDQLLLVFKRPKP